MLYLVVKEGVYDQGVYYAAESQIDAEKFTQEYAPDSDGYHKWRIDPIELGVPVEDEEWVSAKNRVHRR